MAKSTTTAAAKPAAPPPAERTMDAAAVCTVAFLGVPDGQVIPRQFEPGDAVLGDLAAVALREGWAERAAPAA